MPFASNGLPPVIPSQTEPLTFLQTDVLPARMFQIDVLSRRDQCSVKWTTDLTCLESASGACGSGGGTDLVSVTVDSLRPSFVSSGLVIR